MLLSAMNREDRIESAKFELQYRAALLDKESHEDVENYNQLMRNYRELVFPKIRDRHAEKTLSEKVKDLSKLKFRTLGTKNLSEMQNG